MDIQDEDQVQPAFAGQHTGRVRHPELVRPYRLQLQDAVGHDGAGMAAVGRCRQKLGPLPGPEDSCREVLPCTGPRAV